MFCGRQIMNFVTRFKQMMADPKERVAFSSVLAAVLLVSFKLYVGIMTNSLGILSEALHSGLDLMAAAITLAAVITASRPADSDHQFGHGKVESFSALIETILLLITCVWIFWEAAERIFVTGSHVEANAAAFLVMGISIIVDISRSRALYKAAKKYNSQALEADALHFSSDILSSSVVIIGLIFVYFGFPMGDPLAAIGVAILVIIVSLRLGKRTIDILMDKAPEGKTEEIQKCIETIDGVKCERVRVRVAGAHTFVDTKITLERNMPFEVSHDVQSEVEAKVHHIIKDADVMVHAEPRKSTDEDLRSELAMMASKTKGITGAHNIEIHRIDKDITVNMHIEMQPNTSIKEAHATVSDFECKAKRELAIKEINTHIESLIPNEIVGKDATDDCRQIVENIKKITEEYAKKYPQFKGCYDITVRVFDGKMLVNLCCHVSEDETLDRAHKLATELENIIRSEIKEIYDVTTHMEPHVE